MPSFETTTTISASSEQVWSVLANVTHWPDWTPTMRSIAPLDQDINPDLALGRPYRVLQPKLRPAILTVTTLTPGKEFTWESRQPGLRGIAEHRVTAIDDNVTLVTLSMRFTGLIAPLIWPFIRGLVRNYLTQEARSLKTRVEG